jgi:hypothetical protein
MIYGWRKLPPVNLDGGHVPNILPSFLHEDSYQAEWKSCKYILPNYVLMYFVITSLYEEGGWIVT